MKHNSHYEVEGKRVLIVGLARTGAAVANLLKRLGAHITITDKKRLNELTEHIGKLSLNTDIKVGKDMNTGLLSGKDMVVVSPGVPCDHYLLNAARKSNITVISEMELACSLAESPIIAITGTNGKTTVSIITNNILSQGCKNVMLCGNIGTPLSEGILDSKEKDFIVLEVSSFQLEWIDYFKPYIAMILNMTPDHIDRHKSMEEYINLKRRIYYNQTENDYLILNKDDAIVSSFAEDARSRKLYFSRSEEVSEGTFIKDKRIMVRYRGEEEMICLTDDLKARGIHNIENVLASITASFICKVDCSSIKEAVVDFKGIEHRMELVRDLNGIKFINDSKATNVGAVVKSLEGIDGPVILIAGGLDKGNDYAPLKKLVEDKVKSLVLIGEAREKIKNSLSSSKNVIEAESIEKAVKAAYLKTARGDTVLLSPACASFDMFRDYEERGRRFKDAVNRLRKRPFEIH